jgi:predicted secreted protein
MFVAALMLVSVQAAADPSAAAQAVADPSAVVAPVAPVATAKPKEKKICRVDDADSGSHMIRRICLTAEEWQNRGKSMVNSSRSGFTGKVENN